MNTDYLKLEMKGTPVRIQQAEGTFEIFSDFFNKEKIDYVIEIGTGGGWLSMFLYEQSVRHSFNFSTYDINQNRIKPLLHYCKGNLPFDYRIKDCFEDIESIKNILVNNRCVLMCDGGNKIKEVNTFSKHLQENSFIMAHDYAPSRNYFEEKLRDKIWGAFEIKDKDIYKELTKNKTYKSKYYDHFLEAAWLSCIKSEDASTLNSFDKVCDGKYT